MAKFDEGGNKEDFCSKAGSDGRGDNGHVSAAGLSDGLGSDWSVSLEKYIDHDHDDTRELKFENRSTWNDRFVDLVGIAWGASEYGRIFRSYIEISFKVLAVVAKPKEDFHILLCQIPSITREHGAQFEFRR